MNIMSGQGVANNQVEMDYNKIIYMNGILNNLFEGGFDCKLI
jgi:hypothetical protein